MSEAEKEQAFSDTIDSIKENEDFQKLKKYRDKLDEYKKLKMYNDGEIISIKGSIKHATKVPGMPEISLNPFKQDNSLTNILGGQSIIDQAAPFARVGVTFGLLDKPQGLSEEKLLKNISKDAKKLRKNFKIFSKVCSIVPQLRVAYPFVKALIPYTERYEKHGTEIIKEKLTNHTVKEAQKQEASLTANCELEQEKKEIEAEKCKKESTKKIEGIGKSSNTTVKENSEDKDKEIIQLNFLNIKNLQRILEGLNVLKYYKKNNKNN